MWAPSVHALSDAQAEAAFEQAAIMYADEPVPEPNYDDLTAAPPGAPDEPFVLEGKQVMQRSVTEMDPSYDVKIISEDAEIFHAGAHAGANVDLSHVRLAVDMEDVTVKELIDNVVDQAERLTGPWAVKWRLKPENHYLVRERVNLVAEAEFGDFVRLLSERIKNMSGVELFVTVFQASRVIIIADTYY